MSKEFNEVVSRYAYAITKEEAASVYDEMSFEYKKNVDKKVFVDFMASKDRENILWHDYEAGGTDAVRVAPMQFAAIRTDTSLNIIDVPTDIYCQLHGDKLPHPVAVAITHINPLTCTQQGLPEPTFFRVIQHEMMCRRTCTTGYNSMGYDETITRFGFWRNLLPVYTREYADGNTRWDLLSVTAAYKALGVTRGIKWPTQSLKLESLCEANNITQENAHNALDDVKALIDWARLLRTTQPELWDYLYRNRLKKPIINKVKPGSLVLMTKAGFGEDNHYCEPLLVVGNDMFDRNKVIAVKLRYLEALRECWKLDVDTLRERLYAKKELLEEKEVSRPPFEAISVNKCPAIFDMNWVQEVGLTLPDSIDLGALQQLATKIMSQPPFVEKIISVYQRDDNKPEMDPEVALYVSGFPSKADTQNINQLASMSTREAFKKHLKWENPIYQELWLRCRFKMSGFGIELTEDESQQWSELKRELRANAPSNSKHDFVTDATVNAVLEQTDMSVELKNGYKQFLSVL